MRKVNVFKYDLANTHENKWIRGVRYIHRWPAKGEHCNVTSLALLRTRDCHLNYDDAYKGIN